MRMNRTLMSWKVITTTKSNGKRIPQRMCIGCREMKDRTELIRIVKNKEGAIFLDDTGKAQGRGAYICANPECFRKIKKSKGLDRTYKTSVPDSVYETLEKELDEK